MLVYDKTGKLVDFIDFEFGMLCFKDGIEVKSVSQHFVHMVTVRLYYQILSNPCLKAMMHDCCLLETSQLKCVLFCLTFWLKTYDCITFFYKLFFVQNMSSKLLICRYTVGSEI